MVADHWFMQIENVLEAMEITSDTTRIRLVAFQLESEAQVWWRWARTSRDLEVMTWAKFQELFMGKYFPETARHAKAQEFLELKQGATTVMDYMARFTKLAQFADDYVATDLAKVRRFKNGLKLSIFARIVGLRLQDMDSMVRTALTIEREMEDARSTRDASVSSKRKDNQSSSSSGKRQRASSSRGSQSRGHPGQGQMRVTGQAGQMVCYHCQHPRHMRRDCPTGIPGLWDNAVPVSCKAGESTVHSSTPKYGSEEPVSGCYTSTFGSTGGPEELEGGSRSGTGLRGRDF